MRRTQGAVAARRLLAMLLALGACGREFAAADDLPAAFHAVDRWDATAIGDPGSWGDGLTLTWSIVPDGAIIPSIYTLQGEQTSPSDFVARFDAAFGAGSGPAGDLTERPWFPLVSESLTRWGDLSGIDFAYEPADDGARILAVNAGVAGVRGDIRVGGHAIDGDPRSPDGSPAANILGYGFFPTHGDFVLDTSNLPLFADPAGNHLVLRNTLMHEFGHTLGLAHDAGDADPLTPGAQPGTFLMEAALSTTFDGPQLDDILGIQQLYGDRFEKSPGNDVAANATPLGALARGETAVVGADADSVRVEPTEVDFVSIDAAADVDVFSFSLLGPGAVEVTLTPMGAPYVLVGPSGAPAPVDPRSVGDLMFEVLAADAQTVLASVNATGAGGEEFLNNLRLDAPGEYFVRVAAATATPQLYRLEVAAAVPEGNAAVLAAMGALMCSAAFRTDRKLAGGPRAPGSRTAWRSGSFYLASAAPLAVR